MIIFPYRKKIASKNLPKAILDSLDAFYRIASSAHWKTGADVKRLFPTAEVLKDGRIILDIENAYHLIVRINPEFNALQVLFFEPYGNLSSILAATTNLNKEEEKKLMPAPLPEGV